ncbi:MAG: ABC transporter permease subunit [Oscillospiraceae bacterium]
MLGKIERRLPLEAEGVSKNRVLRYLQQNWEYLIMVLPGLLCILVFCYLPMFGLVIAFKNIDYSKGILGSDWAGLKNFEFLFNNPDVFIIIRNTLLYNLAFIVLGVVIPVTFALLLSQMNNRRTAKVYQTVMFLPYFLSWVVVSYLVFAMLNYDLGVANNTILAALGMDKVNWYQSPKYWPWILVFLAVWKATGYNSVMYLAAIVGIDSEIYEASAIDGANKFQQAMKITLPSLAPIITILTILAIGKMFNSDFGLFYNVPMRSGVLLPVTNTIDTFTYTALQQNNDIGMASAVGFLQSIIGFVLVLTTNYIVTKVDDTRALF